MADSCPKCSAAGTDTECLMELPPDSRSDEITVYLNRCSQCQHRFLGVYEESRRGALGEDHWNYHSIDCKPARWEELKALIDSCATPRDAHCRCPAHLELGARDTSGYWLGVGPHAKRPRQETVKLAPPPQATPRSQPTLSKSSPAIRAIAWSPDGERIAVATGDGRIAVRAAKTGRRISSGPAKKVQRLWWDDVLWSFGGDGARRGAPGESTLVVDVQGGRCSASSADGSSIAVGHDDGAVQIFDTSAGAQRARRQVFEAGSGVNALCWSPDGKLLACGGSDDEALRTIAVATGSVVWRRNHGQVFFSGSGDPFGFPDEERAAEVFDLAFTADGSTLVCAGEGEYITMWRRDGEPAGKIPVNGWTSISVIATCPRGAMIAAGDRRGAVHIAELEGAVRPSVYELSAGEITAVAFSPDGSSVAVGDDSGELQILDPNGGRGSARFDN